MLILILKDANSALKPKGGAILFVWHHRIEFIAGNLAVTLVLFNEARVVYGLRHFAPHD